MRFKLLFIALAVIIVSFPTLTLAQSDPYYVPPVVGHKCYDTNGTPIQCGDNQSPPQRTSPSNGTQNTLSPLSFVFNWVRARVVEFTLYTSFHIPKLNRWVFSLICPQPVWYTDPITGAPVNDYIISNCQELFPGQKYGTKQDKKGPTNIPPQKQSEKTAGFEGAYSCSITDTSPIGNQTFPATLTITNGAVSIDGQYAGTIKANGNFISIPMPSAPGCVQPTYQITGLVSLTAQFSLKGVGCGGATTRTLACTKR